MHRVSPRSNIEEKTPAEVAVDSEGPALWLRLNRPDVLNSLNLEMIEGLHIGLDHAEQDAAVRCAIISGIGRAFCAGADLKYVNDSSEGSNSFRRLLGVLLDRIEKFPKPVIAAVNGVALAGGLELILCCDMVLAAESARIGDGHANYGLLPGGGASVRLPRVVGRNRARYMFFTGDLFSASDLQEWGLVNQVVPDGSLTREANRLASRLGEKSTLGLERMKHLAREAAEQPTSAGLSLELLYSALHEKSHDMNEGIRAFVEKRRPTFDGR